MNDPARPRALANIAGSAFVTLLTIAAVYLCAKHVIHLPSPTPILLIAVVFSAFAGGLPAGLLSAAMVIAFGTSHMLNNEQPNYDHDLAVARVLTLAVAAPTMAILVGLLKQRTLRTVTSAANRESDERFRQALVNAPVPVLMHAEDGEILLVSNEWSRQSGYASRELPHLRDWLLLAHGDRAREIEAGVSRLFELPAGAPEADFTIRTKSGEDRIWSATVSAPGTLADGRRYLIVIARDVTEATRINDALTEQARMLAASKEQSEAANRAKDRFLASISHELRTPLTPVLLTAAALQGDSELPARIREDIQLIHRNVQLEARLIDDLLDLTRIARGRLRLDERPIDPVDTMRAALDSCQEAVQSKRVHLTLEMPPQSMLVMGDAARLQQVFANLLSNAVKFTPAGGRIQVTCDEVDGRFCAEVADTGIGIPQDVLPRIFDAFEQGAEKLNRQFGGLGLGLAICKKLVELHGGILSASSPGRDCGATFRVELPLVDSPADSAPQADRTEKRNLRILLVEDHAATSRVLSILLRQLNHQVTSAPTVADALRHAEQSSFDLLISDLGLPDGTGVELMRQIREKHKIAGICLSGYDMDQDFVESRAAGFLEHLVKPVDLSRLKSAIRNVTA